jgi:hypothetical protein
VLFSQWLLTWPRPGNLSQYRHSPLTNVQHHTSIGFANSCWIALLTRRTSATKLHGLNGLIAFVISTLTQLTFAQLAQFVWAALTAPLRHARFWSWPTTSWQKRTRWNTVLRWASSRGTPNPSSCLPSPWTPPWTGAPITQLEWLTYRQTCPRLFPAALTLPQSWRQPSSPFQSLGSALYWQRCEHSHNSSARPQPWDAPPWLPAQTPSFANWLGMACTADPMVAAGDAAVPCLAVTTVPLDHDAMRTDHQSLRVAIKQNLSTFTNHRPTARELADSWMKWTAGETPCSDASVTAAKAAAAAAQILMAHATSETPRVSINVLPTTTGTSTPVASHQHTGPPGSTPAANHHTGFPGSTPVASPQIGLPGSTPVASLHSSFPGKPRLPRPPPWVIANLQCHQSTHWSRRWRSSPFSQSFSHSRCRWQGVPNPGCTGAPAFTTLQPSWRAGQLPW